MLMYASISFTLFFCPTEKEESDKRRRRCRPAPFPGGELFLSGCSCERSPPEGKRGYRRTGNPFIKALVACLNNTRIPEKAGFPPPPGCYLLDS